VAVARCWHHHGGRDARRTNAVIVAAEFAINPSLRRKLPYDTLRAVWLSNGEMK
jgi:hypothetical protein